MIAAIVDRLHARVKPWKPLAVVAMMLFAVPFVFGSLRNSRAGFRLMIGVGGSELLRQFHVA